MGQSAAGGRWAVAFFLSLMGLLRDGTLFNVIILAPKPRKRCVTDFGSPPRQWKRCVIEFRSPAPVGRAVTLRLQGDFSLPLSQ